MLGGVLMAFMTTWQRGRALLRQRWEQESLPLASFLARLPQSRTIRVPGIAVFLTGTPQYVPGALLHNLKHNKVLHERVLFATVQNIDRPEGGIRASGGGRGVGTGHPPGGRCATGSWRRPTSRARSRSCGTGGVAYDPDAGELLPGP